MVLDPAFALRRRMHVPPGTTARLSFWTTVAASRAGVLDLVDKLRDANSFARVSTLAWTQAQVQLRHIGVTAEEATLFQRIAGHLIYADASLRPSSDVLRQADGLRPALWAQSISGDLPIVLLRIDEVEDAGIVRQLLRAHEYWRLKRLAVDLVILNERGASYVQDLQSSLETLARTSQSRPRMGGVPGAVFLLRADLISAHSRAALFSAARVVFAAQRGSLDAQLDRRTVPSSWATVDHERTTPPPAPVSAPPIVGLEFFNEFGGFASDGRDYVMQLGATRPTPVPWVNVISNANFGCHISAEGSGYTWSINSRENQLTQWSNDPVSDRSGEALYVRDDDTGELWGPTLAPIGDRAGHYAVRHAQGFSQFEYTAHGIALELTVFVPRTDPVKIFRLRLRNLSGRRRRLSVTAYVEWVLGTQREASAPFIFTEIDEKTGAMFARNPWNTSFGTRVAFADLGGLQRQWTGDRREFLGRHGRLDRPAALAGMASLSGRVGGGIDPCAALLAPVTLAARESTEVAFFLGEVESAEAARELLLKYRAANLDVALDDVTRYWDEVLETVQVKTPDRSLDIMLNRWLLYQTLGCRLWARSAFYQASGAYGFRDQLQDGMALALTTPHLTREHLLRAARRQFVEGDVQHWWLPSSGVGVRTRISDDRIWLAYAAAHYLDVSGDTALLDEPVPFIEGARLHAGEHDAFFEPQVSETTASFFEHCALALDASLKVGAHGLPLMGTGDWNDGMNRVGEGGRGESVWLGWFLFATLSAFAPVARARDEHERAASWLAHAQALRESLEDAGWDGAWYRRGYFDDGTPLGSAASEECRIDSIAQSWSVLSGAANDPRARRAMAAVDGQLILRDAKLALLFTPPFDRTAVDPGYIKGYPPGIRENGGQYTHAAAWSILAFARLGEGDRAAELFALLNPINHGSTRADIERYKVEPYVVAADVYSVEPHVGRGGWTWYTGSAGWLYRAGLEGILGFRKEGEHLLMNPCIPREWREFEIHFKHRSTRYTLRVENPEGVSRGVIRVELDGVSQEGEIMRIPLCDDGASHQVRLTLGNAPALPARPSNLAQVRVAH
jgi:cyclic beta-1,2-glucan synthetase